MITSKQKLLSFFVFATALFGSLISCSDFEDLPEVVSDLRGVGVHLSQAIIAEGITNINVTAYFVTKNGVAPTFTEGRDSLSQNRQASLSNISSTIESLAKIDLHTVTADITLPTTIRPSDFSVIQGEYLRYYLAAQTADKEINTSGTVLVVEPTNPLLSLSVAAISGEIALPDSSTSLVAGSEVALDADIAVAPNDQLKISWFVTGGEVMNFRSTKTVWNTEGIQAGEVHTILMVARGTSSKTVVVRSFQAQF